MRGLRSHGWRRWAGVWFVAIALAVRLTAPAGWMLAGDGHGAPQLVICTGHGAAALDRHDGAPLHIPGKAHDMPCVYAGPAAPPAPAPIAIPIGSPTPAKLTAPANLPVDQRPGRGLAAPPPPSHGPPDIA